ncbi:MAG: desulfoferrodoxin family protein [Candidatus Binatia bacterium]
MTVRDARVAPSITFVCILATLALVSAAVDPIAALADSHGEDPVPEITPAFDKNKTAHDPKHTPKITAPDKVKAGEWFDVTIAIGKDAVHPSMDTHFVRYIALYNNDVEISRTYLHPVFSQPKVTYTIRLKQSTTLRAMEEANHTAGWISEHPITVE